MDASTIEIRFRRAEDLRAWWLDGFEEGGLFVPGTFALSAGTPVLLRIFTELPTPSTTLLTGTVIWRRLPPRLETPGALRAGVGIAFDASMRHRVLFLDRLGRGAAHDGRTALRYPTRLASEVGLREGERAQPGEILDVSPHGARVHLIRSGLADVVANGGTVKLWVAPPVSGEASFSPLAGRVAWLDRSSGDKFGLRLELATKDDRLHWAKVVTRCREAVERERQLVDRLVG